MLFTVLGCSGGIGEPGGHTTSFLVDDDILIDAGTGVSALPLAALARIEHVFLTHSHLDHLACLPLLIDSVADLRERPVVVHGHPETLEALQHHIFNDVIWPDFSRIPSSIAPLLRYEELLADDPYVLGERRITALPVDHGIPAYAYLLESPTGSLLFSGDTAGDASFWRLIEARPTLQHLVVEVAFAERCAALAHKARHIHPSLAIPPLTRLPDSLQLHITHTKPGHSQEIRAALRAALGPTRLDFLVTGQVIPV